MLYFGLCRVGVGGQRVTVFRVCFVIALGSLKSLLFQREADLRDHLQKFGAGYSSCTSMFSHFWH